MGLEVKHFYIVCTELILDAQYSRILRLNIVIKIAHGDCERNVFRKQTFTSLEYDDTLVLQQT